MYIHTQATWAALREAVTELAPRVDALCVACNQLHCFEPQIRELLQQLGQDPAKFISIIGATTSYCQAARVASASQPLAIFGGPITTDLDGLSPYRPLAQELGAWALTYYIHTLWCVLSSSTPLPRRAHDFVSVWLIECGFSRAMRVGGNVGLGRAVCYLGAPQRDALRELITTIKRAGGDGGESALEGFEAILHEMVAMGVHAVLLACTELPLVAAALEARCAEQGRQMPPLLMLDPTDIVATAVLDRRRLVLMG